MEEWLALIDRLDDLRQRRGVTLTVIDPLAEFLPGRDENIGRTDRRSRSGPRSRFLRVQYC
jgi:hypothetical protein